MAQDVIFWDRQAEPVPQNTLPGPRGDRGQALHPQISGPAGGRIRYDTEIQGSVEFLDAGDGRQQGNRGLDMNTGRHSRHSEDLGAFPSKPPASMTCLLNQN